MRWSCVFGIGLLLECYNAVKSAARQSIDIARFEKYDIVLATSIWNKPKHLHIDQQDNHIVQSSTTPFETFTGRDSFIYGKSINAQPPRGGRVHSIEYADHSLYIELTGQTQVVKAVDTDYYCPTCTFTNRYSSLCAVGNTARCALCGIPVHEESFAKVKGLVIDLYSKEVKWYTEHLWKKRNARHVGQIEKINELSWHTESTMRAVVISNGPKIIDGKEVYRVYSRDLGKYKNLPAEALTKTSEMWIPHRLFKTVTFTKELPSGHHDFDVKGRIASISKTRTSMSDPNGWERSLEDSLSIKCWDGSFAIVNWWQAECIVQDEQ